MNKELLSRQAEMVASIYKRYAQEVKTYISVCIHNDMEAEDMTHDIFERVMEIDIISEETSHALLILMARRKVIDYFRHKAIARNALQELKATINYMDSADVTTQMMVKQVFGLEKDAVACLKTKEAMVYRLWRMGDKTMKEMAMELDMNHRTIERYIYNSRRKVVEYIQKAI